MHNKFFFYLKTTTILLCLALGHMAKGQVSVTASAGTLGPTLYTTVSDAFSAINAGSHQGVIELAIVGNTTEPATPTALLNSTGTASYTSIRIAPSGGDWIINSAATPTASRGVIELRGADNVTIDGDDPLTPGARNLTILVATSTATGTAAIRLSSNSTTGLDGADNNTVRNCIIVGARSSATSTTTNYGINMSNYSATSMTTGAYSSINTLIENNLINRCYHGIYANGTSATYLNTGTIIRGNILGSANSADNIGNRGIFVSYSASTAGSGSVLIENNDIRGGAYTTAGYSATVAGIEMAAANAGAIVRKNNIHDVYQQNSSGYGAFGISITSATSNTGIIIENNFIRDMVASKYSTTLTSGFENYGVYISAAATGIKINNNTIALLVPNTTGTVVNSTSACITITSATATLAELQNNILTNVNVSTQAFGIYTAGTVNISGGLVNNNNYYLPGGSIGYYSGATVAAFPAWQIATSKDAQSFVGQPPFTSNVDLHIVSGVMTPLESGGAAIGLNSDIDNEVRPGPIPSVNGGGTAPDIGADEFDGIPLPLNDVIAAAFITPASGFEVAVGSITPQATFSNGGSAIQTNVTVRFQILDASNTIVYNSTGVIPSLAFFATVPVSFSSTTLAAGTYTIKAIAELSGDANMSNDTIVGNITVVSPLCGDVHIGVAQAAPFNSVSTAVGRLNTAGVSCPVRLLLDDATPYNETARIIFNESIPGVSATNTVTLKPNTGIATTISGDIAGNALMTISSGNVIVDGSNAVGGISRDLVITNTSATAGSTINLSSVGTTPLTDVVLKNSIIINGTTNSSVIAAQTSTATAGYFNNITIQNNSIQKGYNGIFMNAVTAVGNGSGTIITGNDLNTSGVNALRFIGISILGFDGITISNNQIGNFSGTDSEIDRGIILQSGVSNATVSGNTISDLNYSGTATSGSIYGIQVNTGVATGNIIISENTIQNLSSTGTSTTIGNALSGIYVSGASGGVVIARNKLTNIRNTHATGYSAFGIHLNSSVAASGILVANNFVADVSASGNATVARNGYGMYLTAGGGYSVLFNTVHLFSNQTATAGHSAALNISSGVSASAALDIRNNNLVNKQTVGNVYAIYSGAAIGAYSTIDYNNYWSSGANLGYIGSARATLADIVTGFGQNAGSQNVMPAFTSGSDLHLLNVSANIPLDGAGVQIATITSDIDLETRNNPPDIGADEFLVTPCSLANGGIASAVNPSLCVSGSSVLTNAGYSSGAGTDYQWEFSLDGFTTPGVDLVGATTPASANTGTITVTTSYRLRVICSAGAPAYSNVVTVSVNPLPVVTASPSTALYCSPLGAPVVLNAGGAATYVWSPSSGLSATTGSSVSASPSVTTTYTVTGTDLNGCTETATVDITVSGSLTVGSLTATPSIICAGDNSLLAANVSVATFSYCLPVIIGNPGAGGDYLNDFSFANITNIASGDEASDYTYYNLLTANVVADGVTAYPVSLTAGGTSSTYAQQFRIWIDFNQNGVFEASESVFNTTTATFVGGTGTAAAPATGTVVIPTSAYNGITRMRVFSKYSSTPGVSESCQSASGAFGEYEDYNINITGGVDPITYAWSPSTFLTGTSGNTTTATAVTAPTTYTVTATSAAGCSVSDNVTLNVNSPVSISIHPSATVTVCESGSFNLSVVASNAVTYQWFNGATPVSNSSNISGATSANLTIANATIADAGSYTVTIDGAAPCTAITSTASVVTVNPLPVVASITGNSSVCVGATTMLASATPAGIWSTSDPLIATIDGSGTVTGVAAGNATITYTVTSSGCSSSVAHSITVTPLPVVAAITGNSSVCVGVTTMLASATPAGIWSTSDPLIATIDGSGTVTGVAAGNATITYTVTSSGCSSSVAHAIAVTPLPVVATVTGNSSVCVGATTTLTNATPAGIWSTSDPLIASIDGSGSVTGVAAGNATITYTVTSSGCSSSVAHAVAVTPLPTVAAISGNNSVCVGATTTLTNATPAGIWSTSDPLVASVNGSGTVTGVAAGNATITYTVTSSGCSTAVTHAIVVNSVPVVAAITGTNSVCAGSETTLANTTPGGLWSSSNTNIATVNANGDVTGVAPGTSTISYTVSSSGCSNAATAVVTVNALASSLPSGTTNSTINQEDGTTNDYSGAGCEPIVSIADANGGAVLGVVTATVTDAGMPQVAPGGEPYVERYYTITAGTNTGLNATVTLYVTDAEFAAYNSHPAASLYPPLPTNGVNNGNVKVTRFATSALGGPGNPGTLITPSVLWNAANSWWEISFPVTSLSSFYIHSNISGFPLDIELRDITAVNVDKRNRVDWTTINEANADRFELERSADGVNFVFLGVVNAKGEPSTYSYWDENPISGLNYYRLKMFSKSGEYKYTRTVTAFAKDLGSFSLDAYPNPTVDRLIVRVGGTISGSASIVLTDVSGKLLQRIKVSEMETQVNLNELAQGMYFIKYSDEMHTRIMKIQKK